MALDLVVQGGTLVTSRFRARAGIGIKDGKVVAIAAETYLPEATQTLDAAGLYVLPGVIDAHVHSRDPGFTHLEDIETASQAAAAGGVTLIIDMPGSDEPVLSNVKAFENKVKTVQGRSYVDFALRGAALPENLDDIPALVAAGVVGFKIQMGKSVREPAVDDEVLLDCFERLAAVDRPGGVHAENDGAMNYLTRKLKSQGREDALAHLESRPNMVEAEAIQRAIFFSRYAGNRLHIHHISTREGAALLAEAKAQGLPVTGETCPHYLLLDTTDYDSLGSLIKVNPPIKSPEDREALWDALRDGTIDVLATDHAPHSKEEKMQASIWRAVSGFAGVEIMVPLILTEVNRGRISLERFVHVTAEKPAQVFGLYPRKGSLAIGSDADITVVDVTRRGTIDMDKLHSKATMTPFHGREVVGMSIYTLVRGNLVAKAGAVLGPAIGSLICP